MTGIPKLHLFLAFVAASVLCAIPAWADPPSQIGRLSIVSGSVSFRPGSLDEWGPATLNYPMTAGDHLWTDANARAEVHVLSAAIRLDSYTEFSFISLDDQAVQVAVSQGTLGVNLRSIDNGTYFEIDTPNAAVSLLAAGNYRVDVQPNGETTVTVRSGRAEVTAGRDVYNVSSGRSSIIYGIDSISYYVTAAPQPDQWDAWSLGRDRREDQVASNSYVSREMIGAEDLAEYGTWRVVAGYGPTWTPSRVPDNWAPYRFGHWTWVAPWGWTWIDDTPWGFAPFHYGRWAFLSSRWAWIPGARETRPVYAPALVVFVGGEGWTSAHGGIGWFPLGPREIYIPPYQASTSYVLKINVAYAANINAQTIERFNPDRVVYVNRGAPRAVTVVPRQVFVQSRPAGAAAISISPVEATRAPLMGMRAIVAPQRESLIASPPAAKSSVLQPPSNLQARIVVSRIAPPPAQVPFAQQQKDLDANPGRPVDTAALSRLQQDQRPAPAVVAVVNPATLNRPKVVPTVRNAPPSDASDRGSNDQGGSGAASLIATLKTRTLPEASRLLAEAQKVAGIRLDLRAAAQQIEAARVALARAEKYMADKNSKQALQDATGIKKQLDDLMKRITDAMQAARQPVKQPGTRK